FESKLSIYDAMYGQAWSEFEALSRATTASADFPTSGRERIKAMSHLFFDFAVADLARYQLMNQRSVPGFTPSAESYAPAVREMEQSLAELAAMDVTDRGDVEIWFALLGGLVDQQLANDPGGTSRKDLLDRAVDMWADSVGLTPEQPREGKRQ
ncbi:MAG TPA: hypothetical protein VIU11_25620, partial [Nakamurella sp.]